MTRQYKNHKFFLFEVELNNPNKILSFILVPLFIETEVGKDLINLRLIRDIDYSFESKDGESKRYILTVANKSLKYEQHLHNMGKISKTGRINPNTYKTIFDVIYDINSNNPIKYNESWNFSMSYHILSLKDQHNGIKNASNKLPTFFISHPCFNMNTSYLDNFI